MSEKICPKCGNTLTLEPLTKTEQISLLFNDIDMYTAIAKYWCRKKLNVDEICDYAMIEFKRA